MHKNASVFKKYLKYLYLSFSHLSIYLSKKYCFIMFMGYRYLTNSTKLRILILGDSDVKQRDIVNALVTFVPDLSHHKIIFEKN